MKSKIKVTLVYRGHFKTIDSQDYTIDKVVGAPTVEIQSGTNYYVGRVGDMITERQATELANRVEVTTVRSK